jgi:hypothetical protein
VEKLEPAAVLEDEIQDHESRLAHLDRSQPLARSAGADRPGAVRREVVQKERAGDLIVLDDQNATALGGRHTGHGGKDRRRARPPI